MQEHPSFVSVVNETCDFRNKNIYGGDYGFYHDCKYIIKHTYPKKEDKKDKHLTTVDTTSNDQSDNLES
jgi:hypothetical protein